MMKPGRFQTPGHNRTNGTTEAERDTTKANGLLNIMANRWSPCSTDSQILTNLTWNGSKTLGNSVLEQNQNKIIYKSLKNNAFFFKKSEKNA
jgi:hypothetical protein